MKYIIFLTGSTIISAGVLPLFSESLLINAAGILWLAVLYYTSQKIPAVRKLWKIFWVTANSWSKAVR